MLVRCGCVGKPDHASSYQDARYGTGMRVCTIDEDVKTGYCTVCGVKHTFSSGKEKEAIKEAKAAKKAKAS